MRVCRQKSLRQPTEFLHPIRRMHAQRLRLKAGSGEDDVRVGRGKHHLLFSLANAFNFLAD